MTLGESMNNKQHLYAPTLRKLSNYDIISFDIFDTLIVRPFTNPSDVFLTLSPHYYLPDFKNVRIKAEKNARDLNFENHGDRETTIFEIYKELKKISGIDAEKGVALEFETEKQFCYANPFMQNIYQALLQENREIILISNMYYPKDMLTELLGQCGYTSFSNLFVSCDYKLNKKNSELFRYVKKAYTKRKKVIHIGDNELLDYESARNIGWDALHIPINTPPTTAFDIRGPSYFALTFYNAITKNYLNNGFTINEKITKYDPFYRFGFLYGGIVILGYAHYIQKFCQDNSIDAIFFLARDGYFIKEIYDSLFNDRETSYILWSRNASITTMPNEYYNDLFNHYIARQVNANQTLLVKDCLGYFDLKYSIKDKEFKEFHLITKENLSSFYQYLLKYSEEFKQQSAGRKKAAGLYFKKFLKNHKKICTVDLGWRGQGSLSLTHFLQSELEFDGEVLGLLAGNVPHKQGFDSSFTYAKRLNAYMFSDFNNRDICLQFQKSMDTLAPLFEIICGSANMPSFKGFNLIENEVNFEFSVPECENYNTIEQIQQGTRDFIHEFLKRTEHCKYLRNISGRDAYYIFKHILIEPQIKTLFSKYTYDSFITPKKNYRLEKFTDFWTI